MGTWKLSLSVWLGVLVQLRNQDFLYLWLFQCLVILVFLQYVFILYQFYCCFDWRAPQGQFSDSTVFSRYLLSLSLLAMSFTVINSDNLKAGCFIRMVKRKQMDNDSLRSKSSRVFNVFCLMTALKLGWEYTIWEDLSRAQRAETGWKPE